MTGAERDLLALVRTGLDAVDAELRAFWERVQVVLDRYAGRVLTRDDVRAIMREVDREIERTYGLTQLAAISGALFLRIIHATDMASEVPFRRAVDRLRGIVTTRDPALWERIRGMAISGRDDPFMKALRAMDGSFRERTAFLRAGKLDSSRRWVKADGTPYTLAQRVWRQGRDTRRQIDATIRASIRRGDDVATLTKELRRFLNPDVQNAAYAAHRLAQTEVMHAHGIAMVQAGKVVPGATGMKWTLHPEHSNGNPDECDDKARNHSEGMEPGCYTFAEFPSFPTHPFDKCRTQVIFLGERDTMDLVVARYGGAA